MPHECSCMCGTSIRLNRPWWLRRPSTKGSSDDLAAPTSIKDISGPFNVTSMTAQDASKTQTRAVAVFCGSSAGTDVAFTNAAKCE